MSAALEFSLGLATGGFIRSLDEASSELKGFIGGLLGVEAVTERVKAAIEKGAGLEALHKRTGESVSSLYQLQEGFKAAGLSGDDVAGTLMHMQRAIGGVNEMGERTPDIFRRLGLNIETLQKENGPQQLNQIVTALSRLNSVGAAAAASSIFGRMDYANIIQIVNSTKEFGEGMEHASEQARNWQRVSAAFEMIEISMNRLKNIASGFFAGIAEGLVPALQRGLNSLQAWESTLVNIGQSIGRFAGAMLEAFREGKVGELLGLSLQVGFDSFIAILPGMLEKIGGMLLKMFETPLLYLQAGMEYALEAGAHAFITSKPFQLIIKALDPSGGLLTTLAANYIGDSGKPDFAQTLKERKAEGLKFNVGSGEFGIGDIDKDANERLHNAMEQIKKISAPLAAMINGLVVRGGALPPSAHTAAPGEGLNLQQKSNYKFEGTSLEKMGFVMGGQNPGIDYQRRTAAATENMSRSLSQMSHLSLSGMSSFNFNAV